MAEAVKIIHGSGFGHFDLKPGNFMLLRSDDLIVVKPIDFGLSRPLNEDISDKSLEPKGTLNFIDPLLSNRQLNASSLNDVYSLGITYMNMLYGSSYVDLGLKAPITLEKYNEKIKERYTKIYELFDDFLDPGKKCELFVLKGYSQYNLIKMVNQPIKMALNSEIRTTLDELIDTFTFVLREINTESVYLPERVEELYDSVYNDDKSKKKVINMLGSIKSKAFEDIKEKYYLKKRYKEDEQLSSLEKDKKAAEEANLDQFEQRRRRI